jgi:hypothetical protein
MEGLRKRSKCVILWVLGGVAEWGGRKKGVQKVGFLVIFGVLGKKCTGSYKERVFLEGSPKFLVGGVKKRLAGPVVDGQVG